MTAIRPERDGEAAAIHEINCAAFETAAEARLVDTLRARGKLLVSLVAEDDAALVGHIAFSRVAAAAHPLPRGAGLGPMAAVRDRVAAGARRARRL